MQKRKIRILKSIPSPCEASKDTIEVRYDGGVLHHTSTPSNVIWKARQWAISDSMSCPVCNRILPEPTLLAYRSTENLENDPYVICVRCSSLLGLRGLSFDNDTYMSSFNVSYASKQVNPSSQSEGRMNDSSNEKGSNKQTIERVMSVTFKDEEGHSVSNIEHILKEIEKLKLSSVEQNDRIRCLEERNSELLLKVANLEEARSLINLSSKSSLKSKREDASIDAVCLRFIEENYIKTGLREDRIDSSTVWAKYSSWLNKQEGIAGLGRNAFYVEVDKILGSREAYKYVGIIPKIA